jgi:hypothetical protein
MMVFETKTPAEADPAFDYETLLRANMLRVFNERDDEHRAAAIAELWTDDPVMYEANHAFAGRRAVSSNVSELHNRLPAGTMFTPITTTVGHHGTAILRWAAAVPGEQPHTFGTDLAFVEDGRINCFYVFLDPRT